jgi:hypothetical protein
MLFHYSKYWGTWSRVLQEREGWYLEVNLTPINGRYDNSSRELWDTQVRPIIIRTHATPPQPGEMVDRIPAMVVTAMMMNVGVEITHRLLLDDLLSEIDPDRLKGMMRGGGVPLEEVRRR